MRTVGLSLAMNPLVEQMLNATVSNDVETRFLEDLFEHEAKCEADHEGTGMICRVRVVARKTTDCDGKDFLICGSSYKWNRYVMADPDRVCAGCEQDSMKCWTIRPI